VVNARCSCVSVVKVLCGNGFRLSGEHGAAAVRSMGVRKKSFFACQVDVGGEREWPKPGGFLGSVAGQSGADLLLGDFS
jgi:hypothetical protein